MYIQQAGRQTRTQLVLWQTDRQGLSLSAGRIVYPAGRQTDKDSACTLADRQTRNQLVSRQTDKDSACTLADRHTRT